MANNQNYYPQIDNNNNQQGAQPSLSPVYQQPAMDQQYPQLPVPQQQYPPQQYFAGQQQQPMYDQQYQQLQPPNQIQGVVQHHIHQVQGQPLMLPSNLDNYDTPTLFLCPFCHNQAVSQIQHEPGSGTYCCCCMLCLCSVILAFIPFYVDKCQDKKQLCPVCGAQVGFKKYEACS